MSTKKETWKKLEAQVKVDDKVVLRVEIERQGPFAGPKRLLAGDRMDALGAMLSSVGDVLKERAAKRRNSRPVPPPPEEPPPTH